MAYQKCAGDKSILSVFLSVDLNIIKAWESRTHPHTAHLCFIFRAIFWLLLATGISFLWPSDLWPAIAMHLAVKWFMARCCQTKLKHGPRRKTYRAAGGPVGEWRGRHQCFDIYMAYLVNRRALRLITSGESELFHIKSTCVWVEKKIKARFHTLLNICLAVAKFEENILQNWTFFQRFFYIHLYDTALRSG